MALNRFVVLGRVGMDLYADPPGTRIEEAQRYTAAIGGSAGNIAVALARQGSQAALLTRVSDDAVGRYCVSELGRYGVDTRHVRSIGGEARNSLAVVETIPTNTQSVLYRNGAADFLLAAADVRAVDFADTCGAGGHGHSACQRAVAQRDVRGNGAPHAPPRRWLCWTLITAPILGPLTQRPRRSAMRRASKSDIIIGNDDEFGLMAGSHAKGRAFAQSLAHNGAAFTIYKRGAIGVDHLHA